MQEKGDPRHNARVLTLQLLFQEEFKEKHQLHQGVDQFSHQVISEIDEEKEYNKDLKDSLLLNFSEHRNKIDKIIEKLAPEWPIGKISTVDLIILRLAILEGFILKLNPPKVVINEAIELSKEFSNEQTRKFVSGVLGNLFLNQNKYLTNSNERD
jgi:N utilization substance protein B